MKKIFFTLMVFLCALCFTPVSQSAETTPKSRNKITDYLQLPGPIEFDGQQYKLAWSSAPQDGFYIQEYVPDGQNVERYTDMMIVCWNKKLSPYEALKQKIQWVHDRKEKQPVANYQVWKSHGDANVAIDLLISEFGDGEDISGDIMEWNVIRYVGFNWDKEDGKLAGCYTITLSKRAYGENIKKFNYDFRENRNNWMNKFFDFPTPKISAQ